MGSPKILEGNEDFDYYVRFWESIKRDFFKLETLQEYDVSVSPGWPEFRGGQIEKAHELLKELLTQDPAKPYEAIKQKNIQFVRVHLVELPLSEYLHYEIESYWMSISLGEQIFFLLQSDAAKIESLVRLQDFLLFDDTAVIRQNYGAQGEYLHSEMLDETDDVHPYVLLKQSLLRHAVPMDTFLAKHGYPHKPR